MVHEGKGPIRTCCGCGQRDAQERLVRVSIVDGSLMPDLTRQREGRGAYLHRHPECWAAFMRGKGYVRSLRRRVAPAERELLGARLRAALDRDDLQGATAGSGGL
jgi:predicted RNA-binding protein YlxR (DUF448 family)